MTDPLPANMKGDLSNLAEMVAFSYFSMPTFSIFLPYFVSFASNCGRIFKTRIKIC